MVYYRNLSASEVDRVKRSTKRAQTGSQLRSGTMLQGVLTIGGEARIEYESDANMPDLPAASPSRDGIMTSEYAAKLEGLPETLVSTALGTQLTVGGVDVFYDSGPRDITSYGVNVAEGASFQIRRTLDTLIFSYSFIFSAAGEGPLRFLNDLPAGWRPLAPTRSVGVQGSGVSRHDLRLSGTFGGVWNFLTDGSGATSDVRPTSGARIQGSLVIPAQKTLPVSLIGQPA